MKISFQGLLFLITFLGLHNLWAEDQFVSEYTSLKNCRVLKHPGAPKENDPNDDSKELCPSKEGYRVYIEGGDDRTWLVLRKGKKETNLQGVGEGSMQFPNINGSPLEWRYRVLNRQKNLSALIYRVVGQNGDTFKEVKKLCVVHFEKGDNYCPLSCVSTNEEARKLADTTISCPK